MSMRELKFRAWDNRHKSMTHSFTLDNLRQYAPAVPSVVKERVDGELEFMQYTGLKDCKGTEIFEGDILRRPAGKTPIDEHNYVAYEVFWHDNDCANNHIGFQVNRTHFHGNIAGTSDFPQFLPKYTKQLTVIGNIYENPEVINS